LVTCCARATQKNKQEWKKVKTLKRHKKLISGMLAVPDPSGGVQVWTCDIAGTILTWNTKARPYTTHRTSCFE
jgi:hypothetical protein